MEIEITQPLQLDERQRKLLDLHSFVNILNVLRNELHYLGQRSGQPQAMSLTIERVEELQNQLTEPEFTRALAERVTAITASCTAETSQLFEGNPSLGASAEVKASQQNLQSVLEILATRTEEYLARIGAPDQWQPHSISLLRHNVDRMLAAIERNSKGRYHFVENTAALDLSSYLVRLDIHSLDHPQINLPPVMQDVLRDLVANARKYTLPGSHISAQLLHNGQELCLVVEDRGLGIPEKELAKVVEFGYRAVNTRFMATQGSGFGLTKAWWVTQKFGGRMWIKSEVGMGTRITIKIPAPA